MKTKWIVENFTHESSYMDLVKAIKNANMEVKQINQDFKFSDLDGYNQDCPVMFLGSIEMTNLALKQLKNCYPVAYCNQVNYLCSNYISHFGKHLFNDKYAMMTLSELQRQKFLYYGIFGKEAMLFVRPDSGQKTFQAQLIDLLDIDRFVNNHSDELHKLVLVSSPKNIRGEWRFVVSNRKDIIACSTYRYQGQITRIPSAPQGATELVKEILNIEYYPDSVFCVDICEADDNRFYLLELNSFSSAGLYECNKPNIVQKVSIIAEEDWRQWLETTNSIKQYKQSF